MNDKQLGISFNHGLGDCVHFAMLLQLYREAGYQIKLHGQSNKQWLWRAAGVEFTDAGGGQHHAWGYPGNFEHLDAPDHEANKIAFNLNRAPLPSLPGTQAELWDTLCNVRLQGAPHVRPAVHAEADRFIAGLPRPLVAIHSRGTTWSHRKDIPDVECFALIRLLIERGYGVIVLDWDARAPMVAHPHCRAIVPSWCMIDQEQQCALFERLDLLIGIDSGPFHLASLSDLPALGVFRDIQPWRCCIPNPRATYLVKAAHQSRLLVRRERWNFWPYFGPEPTAQHMAEAATMVLGARAPVSVTDDSSIPGQYVYTRVGHDWRPMKLLAGGAIGDGSGAAERRWRVVRLGGEERLLIEGDSGLIAVLTQDWDQMWRGHWTKFECMPIELAPVQEPCGQDVPQAQTRGDGMYWIVDEHVHESALGLRDHEDWIWKHIPTGEDVVIADVGAFIGTFAVWASRRCGKILAFEPHPQHHALLKRNLELNGRDNVVPIATAVGDVAAKVSMGDPDLAAHVLAKYGSGQMAQVIYEPGEIQQSPLDDLLEQEERVDCIKIDVEGAEVRVLQGALATLRKHRPRLLIEVHSHYPNCEHNGNQIAALIEPLGYSSQRICENTRDYYYLRSECR
jgi:FkbM family methyltransferase